MDYSNVFNQVLELLSNYSILYKQIKEIIRTEPHYVAALSNMSALIYQS